MKKRIAIMTIIAMVFTLFSNISFAFVEGGLNNPGFESDLTGWNSWGNATISTNSYSGTKSAELSGGDSGIYQTITGLASSTTYTITAYMKLSNPNDRLWLRVQNYSGDTSDTGTVVYNTTYSKISLSFTTGTYDTSALIYFWLEIGNGKAYIDEISLDFTLSASANSQAYGYPASNSTDNNYSTKWRASNSNNNNYLTIDLKKNYSIVGSRIIWEYSGKNYKYKIETSTNNYTWTLVSDQTSTTSTLQDQLNSFSKTTARYIRITITTVPSGCWAGILEFIPIIANPLISPTPTPTLKTATPTPTSSSTDTINNLNLNINNGFIKSQGSISSTYNYFMSSNFNSSSDFYQNPVFDPGSEALFGVEISGERIRQLENIDRNKEIVVLMDASGSMNTNDISSKKRIDVAVSSAKLFLDNLYQKYSISSKTCKVSVVAYGTKSKTIIGLTDIKSNLSTLKTSIDSVKTYQQSILGTNDAGTNIGYGIRTSGQILKTGSTNSDTTEKYVVLLTDGEPTFYSLNSNFTDNLSSTYSPPDTLSGDKFKLSVANDLYNIGGTGSPSINDASTSMKNMLSMLRSQRYSEYAASYLNDGSKLDFNVDGSKKLLTNFNIRTFAIGLGIDTNSGKLDSVAKYGGTTESYNAQSEEDANAIYSKIANEINNSSIIKVLNSNFKLSLPKGIEYQTDNYIPNNISATNYDENQNQLLENVINPSSFVYTVTNSTSTQETSKLQSIKFAFKLKFNSVGTKQLLNSNGYVDYSYNVNNPKLGLNFDVSKDNQIQFNTFDVGSALNNIGNLENKTIQTNQSIPLELLWTSKGTTSYTAVWSSSDSSIVQINNTTNNNNSTIANITAKKSGNSTISLTLTDNFTGEVYKKSCVISVVNSINVTIQNTLSIDKYNSQNASTISHLNYSITTSDINDFRLAWTIDDNHKNNISFENPTNTSSSGSVDIKALKYFADTATATLNVYSNLPGQENLVVKSYNVSLSLNGTATQVLSDMNSVSIDKFTSDTLSVSVIPGSNFKYSWKSSDPSAISITNETLANGKLSAKITGNKLCTEETITLTITDELTDTVIEKTCKVSVVNHCDIDLPASTSLYKDRSRDLTYSISTLDITDYEMSWDLSDEDLAKYSISKVGQTYTITDKTSGNIIMTIQDNLQGDKNSKAVMNCVNAIDSNIKLVLKAQNKTTEEISSKTIVIKLSRVDIG